MQLNAPHIRAEEVGLPLPGPRDPPTQPPASSWDLTPAGVEIKLPHRKKQAESINIKPEVEDSVVTTTGEDYWEH